jgi:6-phosphogluconolactonase
VEIKEFDEHTKMSRKAAEYILALAETCVKERGYFTVALSGGNSPVQIYDRLGDPPLRNKMPWKKTLIFWGDDRYLPPGDRESNYHIAYEALISKVPIPQENVMRIPTEVKPIEVAASLYETIIRKTFVRLKDIDRQKKLPVFDLVILGVGKDGHTASLFPGHRAVNEKEKWVTFVKAHARMTLRERITITLPVINAARNVMFIIAGEGKGDMIRSIIEQKKAGKVYPATMVKPDDGQTVWFIDKNIY